MLWFLTIVEYWEHYLCMISKDFIDLGLTDIKYILCLAVLI